MTEPLLFMMGKYEARFPADRSYSPNHLWLQPQEDHWRVGFTAWSCRLLQDVYFLDWTIEPQTAVRSMQEIGEIESSKAVSTLYAPFDGVILEFNEELLDDPSAINADNYGNGWLFLFSTTSETLRPEDYIRLLEDSWEETQRTIKGQFH